MRRDSNSTELNFAKKTWLIVEKRGQNVENEAFVLSFYYGEETSMKESKYQSKLIKTIKNRFPGCIVMKNDCNYIQGIPDLTVLYEDHWATLEVKKNAKAKHEPNQDLYVEKMNKMSYSAFIFPENEEETLNAMEQSFSGRRGRKSRILRSK